MASLEAAIGGKPNALRWPAFAFLGLRIALARGG
jgi:hypothetical protein